MMKLAYRVFVVSLFCLSLAIAAVAQTPRVSGNTTVSVDKNKRSAKDDRNTAPTFGTGGPMGGPTGLFTVYDGQTLRKGEYTFSAAYSNFDRDPGDADFTEVPVSFQVGVTNNFELFFNTDAYRAVKVNSPGNLSAFYLPNSRIGGISPAAMVLAPGTTGPLSNRAIYRPAGTQPFLQAPYVGSLGNLGFPVNQPQGSNFGQVGIPTIGGVGDGGGGADTFRGLGSTYGSILPGIVFRSACAVVVPNSGTCVIGRNGILAPTSFTLAPSYLPDAPFINRTYGESAFSTYTAGAKFRFNDVNDWWGLAVVAGYRWYQDSANSSSGFNQLQRGASPGGKWNRGDILVTGAFDGRVAKWFNFSVNAGYHWNASVKSDLFGSDVTILDRPDELLLSAAADFPVNRYFQPIVEFRSLRYIGGRTPNAFENDPYEALAGVRIFPARWFGFSAGYRYHFNQQDADSFSDDTVTLTSWVPCVSFGSTAPQGEGTTSCSAAFIPVTTSYSGAPPGFRASSDPHGFFFQAFIGRRNKRQEETVNKPANVTALAVSDSEIKLGCQPGFVPREGQACNESTTVSVTTTAVDPENDILTYNYTVSGGRIVGSGANVSWDLSGVAPGSYTITAGVDDGCGLCGQTQTQTVTVAACDCIQQCQCATVDVSGPSGITNPGDTMTFTANVTAGTYDPTYNWTVSNGTIESGQGTPSIVVRTTREMAGQNVTATVNIGGAPSTCSCDNVNDSETAGVAPNPEPVLVDEFGAMPNDDIRGRLDLFFAELSNNPNNQGYIINYGTPAQVATRERLIRNHITFRKFDASRITLVNGGDTGSGQPSTKLYRVPPGANNPTP